MHNFNSTSILFCIYFPRFSCLYCKLIKLNSSKSPIYLYVSGGNEDCYYYYYMCYDFDVYYFEHFIIIIIVISYHSEVGGYSVNNVDDVVENDMKMQLMIMILKDSDKTKQLQSVKILATHYCYQMN